jgi:hypothetical protein
MLEALHAMRGLRDRPVLFANHPARSATGLGVYGQDTPAEFRAWNDAAPEVSVGFEGAPGHQAGTLNRDGTLKPNGERGGYGNHPTMGGFDQMTARLVGCGTPCSVKAAAGGSPGPRTPTCTTPTAAPTSGPGSTPRPTSTPPPTTPTSSTACATAASSSQPATSSTASTYLSRAGRGDGAPSQATVGESLLLRGRDDRGVDVEVRIRVPKTPNAYGDRPAPRRINIIGGSITGPVATPTVDTNPTTKVLARFDESNWRRDGDWITNTYNIDVQARRDARRPMGVHVRAVGQRLDTISAQGSQPKPGPGRHRG